MNLFHNTEDLLSSFQDIFASDMFYQKLLIDPSMYHDKFSIGNYLQFSRYIDKHKIKVITEIGSRDAIDSILLGNYYKCPVFAFECNPEAIELCINNVKKYPFVTIEPLACWNKTGTITYYPIVASPDQPNSKNLGAGSVLKVLPNSVENIYTQGNPISVSSIRIDEWMKSKKVDKIDLLCMDCQGATLQVLQGIGDKVKNISYIICEVCVIHAWENDFIYEDINQFLESKGFILADKLGSYRDNKLIHYNSIYINQLKN